MIRPSARPCPRPARRGGFVASQVPELACDYVLLHRETGTASYATRATAAEIHRANKRLQRAGSASRFVAARHLGHHGVERQG